MLGVKLFKLKLVWLTRNPDTDFKSLQNSKQVVYSKSKRKQQTNFINAVYNILMITNQLNRINDDKSFFIQIDFGTKVHNNY